MAPRAYNTETRLQQQLQLKARIAAAAAELHAQQGVVGTSYAQIAARAGVSLPTVYNHFPTQEALVGACTGHVRERAPQLPIEKLLAAPDLPSAAVALVRAMGRLHEHLEPWMVWREHRLVPALSAQMDHIRARSTAAIEQVLRRHLDTAAAARVAPLWEALLHFELWHRLVRQHGVAPPLARRMLVRWLLAAADAPKRPRSSRPLQRS